MHLPGPDYDAALRLLEGVEFCYPIDADERELHQRSEEMKRYYEKLTDRLAALQQGEQPIEGRARTNGIR